MRVLTVSNLFPPAVVGGAELYAGWITEHLARRGHEVGTLTLGVDDAEHLVATARPVSYRPDAAREQNRLKRSLFHAADIWRPDVSRVVRRAIDDFEPDIVHSHTLQGMSISALVAAGTRDAAHVHHLHDYWLLCWRCTLSSRAGAPCGPACKALRTARGAVLRRWSPDVLVSPSTAVFAEHAARGMTFDESATHVIPHPVQDVRTRPPRTPDRPPTFGYLGQVNPNKGIGTMVEAFRLADLDGARLLIAGHGRLVDAMRGRESEGIHALGWVGPEEKEQFFDDIDALIVASEWPEPAGLVINEAKARGVPVVGSRAGGIPEYVPLASRPLLVEPGDRHALAESMRKVAADPSSYSPTDADLAVDWGEHVRRVVAAYEEAIDRRG